jgi:hypothetical protein
VAFGGILDIEALEVDSIVVYRAGQLEADLASRMSFQSPMTIQLIENNKFLSRSSQESAA